MEASEATMKKHNIHLNTSSTSYFGQVLSTFGYSPSTLGYAHNVSSYSPSHEWLIDYGASYHIAKDKATFLAFNDCNTKNIYVGDDISLSIVGYGRVHLDNS